VQSAGAINGRLPLNPSIASRRFSDRAVANVPRASANTQYSRSGAGVSRPAANTPAQSGYHRFRRTGRAEFAAWADAQAGSAAGQRQGSLQRFGEPGSSQNAPRNDRPSGFARHGGWRSFGTPGSSSGGRQPYNPPQNRQSGSGAGSSAPRSAPAPASRPASRPAPKGDKGRK
jgi:hypothetical protein